MKFAISVTNTSQIKEIEDKGMELIKYLDNFSQSLQLLTSYTKPRGIVFHDLKSATEIFSDILLPAYTSRELIHINPQVDVWKRIFLSTVKDNSFAKDYYSSLELADVAVIAAHELTHHADFFRDDFEGDEPNMWFEEGMCFYIPRKLMLTNEKFCDIAEVESMLINDYKSEYGTYTLDEFGKSAVDSTEYASVFYDYWRSTKVIGMLVDEYFGGSIMEIINFYQGWDEIVPLHHYFIEKLGLSNLEMERLWLGSPQ